MERSKQKNQVDGAQSTKYVNDLGEEGWSAEVHIGETVHVQAEPGLFVRGSASFTIDPDVWRIVKYDSKSKALKVAKAYIKDLRRNTWKLAKEQ